jgi:hypothetical protein
MAMNIGVPENGKCLDGWKLQSTQKIQFETAYYLTGKTHF